MSRDRLASPVVAACLAVSATVEIIRTVMRTPWAGYELWFLDLYTLPLAALWAATAYALFAQKNWAWPLVLYASTTLFFHAGVLRLGFSLGGTFFLLTGAVAVGATLLFANQYQPVPAPAPRPSRASRPSLRPSFT